uniref:Uncharacterized protein n=1 Tax=Anguilla anguilla TaxID=7936 RepID=A0A0E9RXA2_ANGAN
MILKQSGYFFSRKCRQLP